MWIFQSSLVSMYSAPTTCQGCNSCQMHKAISEVPTDRWRYAPADASMLFTTIGSVREDEHIHLSIPLCSHPLQNAIGMYMVWFPNERELRSLTLRRYRLEISVSLKQIIFIHIAPFKKSVSPGGYANSRICTMPLQK